MKLFNHILESIIVVYRVLWFFDSESKPQAWGHKRSQEGVRSHMTPWWKLKGYHAFKKWISAEEINSPQNHVQEGYWGLVCSYSSRKSWLKLGSTDELKINRAKKALLMFRFNLSEPFQTSTFKHSNIQFFLCYDLNISFYLEYDSKVWRKDVFDTVCY